ncbi:MAG: ATP-binding protein [Clostridia bacterium]|nr:ATP-binding protein [Clostridia bacterium]MDD4408712.1 ATP-binding protein [Clostridia bacterium]
MKDKIKEILSDRKMTADLIAKDNLKQAFLLHGFRELYIREKDIIIQRARLNVMDIISTTAETEKLTLELQENYSKQDEILKTANLTRKDLTPQYTCSVCEDTGFINGISCDCVNKIASKLNLERLNLKHLKTFKDCDYSIFENALIPKFYKKMQIWANSERKKTSVVLQGDVGTGKTFLLECMASEFMEQNKYVIFTTAFKMNNDFLKYHTIFNEAKMSYLNKYHECEILIIDDLGSEPILRNVTKEYLYLIINQRMIENKTTLISTNLELSDIRDRYGERIFSRLVNKQQNILFKFENEDLRKRRL